MRYKVGAEQVEHIPSLAPSSRWRLQLSQTAAVGPTHAVDATSGVVACGITTDRLNVLEQDWKEAFFVEKCSGCFAAVVQRSPGRGNG